MNSQLRALFAGAGFAIAMANAAFAADMSAKAPMVASAPVSNWTGFYFGAGGGYGMWTADTQTISPTTGACVLCVTQVQGGRGWFGTVGTGFDYQASDRIVFGVLADYDVASLKGTIQDQMPFFAGTIREQSSWQVGARAGWLVTPAIMSYVNGGYSNARFFGTNLVFTGSASPSGFGTPSFSHGGWFIGSGVEAMFSPGWYWRNEYRFANSGTSNLTDSCAVSCSPLGNPQATIVFKPVVQTVRSEIVYKFNWGGPVLAKY